MNPIIEIRGIGKKYNINHHMGGYIALRDIIANIFRNPFAFLKTKTKEVFGIDKKEEFWALKDVNLEVTKGEVIGIIGRNGAGKSTLLKILSQITPPTEGEIKIRGTVGSLLEVGTGFHPELTGRENIFLNGAILGMKKKDIIRKFDEIVKFADIEKFLDTPVKYYSSGMYVRLAFSVAAHMDTDILIIDEVLAVGDSEFQKKCLGKMNEITKESNKTILFVSHNMAAVTELCNRCIMLEDGQIKMTGATNDVINYYNSIEDNQTGDINMRSFIGPFSSVISFNNILINDNHKESSPLSPISITINGYASEDIDDFQLTFSLYNNGVRLFTIFDTIKPTILKRGEFRSNFTIPAHLIREGVYSVAIGGQSKSDNRWVYGTDVATIHMAKIHSDKSDADATGIINIQYESSRIQ